MGDVVDLASRRLRLTGRARCAVCRHEWPAVAPVGTDWLECPACGLLKGRYVHMTLPPNGTVVWVCACGCDVFMVSPASVFCIHCGQEQRF